MMKAYLDLGDKRDGQDHIVCVAAAVFQPEKYRRFVRPWNKLLRDWPAPAFHAADFYPGAQEFKRDTDIKSRLFENQSRRIPHLIGSHVTQVLTVAFRPEEFISVEPEWKARYGTSLHSLAVQLCMSHIGLWAQQNHPGEHFAYFMESGDSDEGDVHRTVEKMKAHPETRTFIRIDSFRAADKGAERGLEAADFVAWHWNKFYMDKYRLGNDEPRKDFQAFIDITGGKVASAFLTDRKLRAFLAIAPLIPLLGKTSQIKS
jgi:hypothetical protein